MQNQEITIEQLLKQLNRPLHFFLINVLIEASQLVPPSCRDNVEQWLDDQPLLKIVNISALDEVKEEDEEHAYPLSSRVVSHDALALFHFYQVVQPSYQPMMSTLSRWLLPESKEENALSNPIKIGHLSIEIANLLFLLVQHGQLLLIIHHWYPFLQSVLNQSDSIKMSLLARHFNVSSAVQIERNYMPFMADILWYRSIFWILMYSIAFACYIKMMCAKNYSIRSLVKLAAINEERNCLKNKLKSILLTRCANVALKESKENYVFISCVLLFVSEKENSIQRDWLGWFDDISDFVLHNTKNREPDSVDHLDRIYNIGNIIQARFHFLISHYLANGVVKIGLMTFIIQTILFPKNYILDVERSAPSEQLSYGLLPWIYQQSSLINWRYYQSNYNSSCAPADSYYFSDLSWITPLLYFMELQLWTWFLIPLVAGIIEMGVIKKISDNYIYRNKENLRKSLIDIMEMMRNHYCLTFKAREVDDLISPAEKAKKIHLIDNIVALIHMHLQKPFLSESGIGQRFFQVPNLLQYTLHQMACMTYQFLKLAYSISATIALFMMIFIIENLPKNRCRRMHDIANAWKINQRESKISSARASFFALKQVKKDVNALISKPAFRYRSPVY